MPTRSVPNAGGGPSETWRDPHPLIGSHRGVGSHSDGATVCTLSAPSESLSGQADLNGLRSGGVLMFANGWVSSGAPTMPITVLSVTTERGDQPHTGPGTPSTPFASDSPAHTAMGRTRDVIPGSIGVPPPVRGFGTPGPDQPGEHRPRRKPPFHLQSGRQLPTSLQPNSPPR